MLLAGSLEDQEYFGEVLLGVRQVIQNHLREVQGKFQDKFFSMEAEIQKRDDIISQLQNRIAELERHGDGELAMTPIGEVDREAGSSGSGSSASSIELPFMVSNVSVVRRPREAKITVVCVLLLLSLSVV